MIGPRRSLGLLVALAALAAPSAHAQGIDQTFREGVELLRRGRDDEALRKFQQVLAADPSQEQAYELFRGTEPDVWVELLVMEGDFELVARRMMGLAEMGRRERQDDADAIREKLAQLRQQDAMERLRVVRQLASEHGEYAVPYMLHALADPDDEERRVVFMQALSSMGDDVVPPLVEALQSPDAYLRRNVALTLGYIGDPRAAGALAALAESDPDDTVRAAAAGALERVGGADSALASLLALGNAYLEGDPDVVLAHRISDVVWHWTSGGLKAVSVPAWLYAEELAKKAFYAGLRLAPDSTEALAGIARAIVSQQEDLARRQELDVDVGDWGERLREDELAVLVAGSRALDLALLWALERGDELAARGLARALGRTAERPTQGLLAALRASTGGAVRGEAAVALGRVAHQAGLGASADVVGALGEAAGREIAQIVGVVDGDAERREAIVAALEERGLLVHAWSRGGRALASLRRVPGMDALLVAESLPDLTFQQVAREVRDDPVLGGTPILVVTADPEGAQDLWQGSIAGTVTGADDLAALEEALSADLEGDRAEADRLAARAARTLEHLALAGHTDVSPAADALAATVGRTDAVSVPAMGALAVVGRVEHAPALADALASGDRSDEARAAAGLALAEIFARNPQGADEAVLTTLHDVVTDADAAFEVREAAATALGRLDLTPDMRSDLMQRVRADVAAEGAEG